jgi:hypothetical protein
MFPLSHFSGISSINKISSSGEDEHSYQEILDNWEDVEIDNGRRQQWRQRHSKAERSGKPAITKKSPAEH